HYQWRERVYMSVLEGKDTFPPEDEYHCVLGRWYHGEGRTAFGSLPAFVRLGDAHSRLHLALSELVHESRREKRTPESVLKKLDMLETASQAVIAALDELDDSVVRQSTVGDVSSRL
ncbi:CZB domain-containing protein, partial [Salmonella enterica]|nr:CZB domain-containing protein [Salmonella enterica]